MAPRIGRGDPEVERIITEMNALNAALRATTDPQKAEEALGLVRQAKEGRPEPTTFEDFITQTAMATILGEAAPTRPPTAVAGHPWGTDLFERAGLAWLAWAAGNPAEARALLGPLKTEPAQDGAVHQLALLEWTRAIEALASGNREEAARFFKRASEIGASFGTESHPIVQWTMAASLFPRPTAN